MHLCRREWDCGARPDHEASHWSQIQARWKSRAFLRRLMGRLRNVRLLFRDGRKRQSASGPLSVSAQRSNLGVFPDSRLWNRIVEISDSLHEVWQLTPVCNPKEIYCDRPETISL